jgi:hypothetical protein
MLLMLLFLPSCVGYGADMHRYLGVQLYNNIGSSLNITRDDIKQYSVWADIIKRKPQYTWSRPLHYIDMNECGNANIGRYCENNCIYSAILNETNTIYMERKNNDITESFKFLIHFLQDLFQPMHVYGPYRGGNDFHVTVKMNNSIKKTNLHYLWDTLFPLYYLRKNGTTDLRVTETYNFSSMLEFEAKLQYYIYNMNKISCKVSDLKSSMIDLNEYYNRFKYDFGYLLQNYINFAVSTCQFIFYI